MSGKYEDNRKETIKKTGT